MSVTPTKIGGGSLVASGQSSVVASLSTSAAAGDDVWAVFHIRGANVSSVTDSKSNTWTIDASDSNGNARVAICHSKLSTALTAGTDTITATLSATSTRTAYTVCKVASGGMVSSSPLDQVASASAATTAVSVGPTGTLAQSDEVAFLAVAVAETAAGEAVTAGGSLTQLDSEAAESGTAFLLGWLGWEETAATSALTLTATISATPTAWAGAVATYKVAAAGLTMNMGIAGAAAGAGIKVTGSGSAPQALGAAGGPSTAGVKLAGTGTAPLNLGVAGGATGLGITIANSATPLTLNLGTAGGATGAGIFIASGRVVPPGYADWPEVILEVAFDNDPLDATLNWIDVSNQLLQWSVTRGRPDQFSSFQPGTAQITVSNQNGLFDPTYTGSPFYGVAVPRKRIRLLAEYAGVQYPLFSGVTQSLKPAYRGSQLEDVAIQAVDWFGPLATAPYNPNPPAIPPNPAVAQGAPAQWGDQRLTTVLASALPGVATSIDQSICHVGADQSLATGETVTILGVTQSGSQTALSMCQSVEVTEGLGACFFIAADGTPTFHNLLHRGQAARSTSVQALLSDEPGTSSPSESLGSGSVFPISGSGPSGSVAGPLVETIQYESLLPSTDDSQLWSDAQVTDNNGTTYGYSSPSAVLALLEAQMQQTTITDTAWAAYDWAARAVNSTSSQAAAQRFDVTMRPVFQSTTAWPVLLGLEVSDLVEAVRNAPSGNEWDELAFVERISHQTSLGLDDWTITLGCSPIGLTQPTTWILGESVLGANTVLF